jgi:hypothetical protein
VPFGLGVIDIAVLLPGGDFLDEGLFVGDAAVDALSSVISLFDGLLRTPFDGLMLDGRSRPRRGGACRRARGRQGRFAPLARWPEDGPSLTAAARRRVARAGRDGRMAAIEQKDGAQVTRLRDLS